MPAPTYRKDYKTPNYLIKTTDLIFELKEELTIVHSKIACYQNLNSNDKSNTLFLNGENLTLLSITKNDAEVDYELSDKGLKISNLEKDFILKISTKINPKKNTLLSGLYTSNNNFCTQCEAHGFRRITYYLDRPDVLSVFTTKIIADKNKYPVLLSNGNLVAKDNLSVTWFDPYPKPCYLFALVAGNFALNSDYFITQNKRKVALKIYCEARYIEQTNFAMSALKKAFLWDEKRFGLSYDLDNYMIVATADFNMGAMENKGLNIFNAKYILANKKSATDTDLMEIDGVIGHEYFHNWSGNRITCKNWFQLSLKEGLTVFREQEFSADSYFRTLKRIDDVKLLRSYQFVEDASPTAHPVRPNSYIKMDNFYTVTVYEKGAEVVRMLHTFLGEAGFQAGMRLYIKRHDGKAADIDDFVLAMADASKRNFKQFMRWYSQKGTPIIKIDEHYNKKNKCYQIKIEQILENSNKAFYLPLSFAFFNKQGKIIKEGILTISKQSEIFSFKNIEQKPIPSWLRYFSAPIKLKEKHTISKCIHCIKYETDGFSRWDNAQFLWEYLLLDTPKKSKKEEIFSLFKNILKQRKNLALTARLLEVPSESYLHAKLSDKKISINITHVFKTRNKIIQDFSLFAKDLLLETYHYLSTYSDESFSRKAIAERMLKNLCLSYLSYLPDKLELANTQFHSANTMTDKFSALKLLMRENNPYRDDVLKKFYDSYQNDAQIIDKWFSVQALSEDASANDIKTLMTHPAFIITNPNRLRALIASFMKNNLQFHTQAGYELLTDIILKLNTTNPQIGARFVNIFSNFRKYTPKLLALQKAQLEKIMAAKNLSNDIFEIVKLALD